MISMKAATEGGRSKLWTRFSQDPYGKKVTKFISRVRASSALSSTPQRTARKLWFDAQGL